MGTVLLCLSPCFSAGMNKGTDTKGPSPQVPVPMFFYWHEQGDGYKRSVPASPPKGPSPQVVSVPLFSAGMNKGTDTKGPSPQVTPASHPQVISSEKE